MLSLWLLCFVGLAPTKARILCLDSLSSIVALMHFWPLGNNRSIFIRGFLKDDILACVQT